MFEAEIAKYVAHVRADYKSWAEKCGTNKDHIADCLEDYDKRVKVTEGGKYIKIVLRGSVHCFIVKEADSKFRSGDVLKPAGFNAPAKNFARANLIDGNFMNISWTGA